MRRLSEASQGSERNSKMKECCFCGKPGPCKPKKQEKEHQDEDTDAQEREDFRLLGSTSILRTGSPFSQTTFLLDRGDHELVTIPYFMYTGLRTPFASCVCALLSLSSLMLQRLRDRV